MASWPPKKNAAFVFYVGLISQADTKLLQANPTLAAGDVKVATDDAAPGNLATLPAVDADFTDRVKVSLSAGEMNGDRVTVIFSDAAGAEWADLLIDIPTSVRQIDDLAFPTVSGRSTDVLATGEVPIDFDTSIGTLAAAQIEASALDGKGDWNVGKTGYSLTQAFPTNFAAMVIAAGGEVDANLIEWLGSAPNALLNGKVESVEVILSGTADSGTTTTFVDAALTQADADYWKGVSVRFYAAGGAAIGGQVRRITGFNAGTDEVTFTPPTTQAVTTNQYEIIPSASVEVASMVAGAIAAGTIAAGELTNIENEIWDALKSAHLVANSFGDFLDIEVSGRLAAADINLTAGVLDEVAALTGHTVQTGDSFARIGALGASLTDLGGMSTAMKAEVLVEVNAALDTAISELSQGVPTATPTVRTGLMLLYMAIRNQLDVATSATDTLEIHNDAGTRIAQKLLTDDGSDYSEAKMTSGA